MEEMSYVLACLPVRFFGTAAHFRLAGRQHFSFSYDRYKNFILFFQRQSMSIIHFNEDIEI